LSLHCSSPWRGQLGLRFADVKQGSFELMLRSLSAKASERSSPSPPKRSSHLMWSTCQRQGCSHLKHLSDLQKTKRRARRSL
jgi:hypothetical protein